MNPPAEAQGFLCVSGLCDADAWWTFGFVRPHNLWLQAYCRVDVRAQRWVKMSAISLIVYIFQRWPDQVMLKLCFQLHTHCQ